PYSAKVTYRKTLFADICLSRSACAARATRSDGGERVMAGVLATVSESGLDAVLVAMQLVLESQAVSAVNAGHTFAGFEGRQRCDEPNKPECKAKREVLIPQAFPFAFTYEPFIFGPSYIFLQPSTDLPQIAGALWLFTAGRPISNAEPVGSYVN